MNRPLLREAPDELQILVAGAADSRGLPAAFVEKDFWVVETLRAAAAPRNVLDKDGTVQTVVPIFKGGTSLSRAFGLIERFSEDVDLLVPLPASASQKRRDTCLREVVAAVAEHLGLPPEDCVVETSTTGVKRNVRFTTPSTSSLALSPGVLLEMGARGGTFPSFDVEIRSHVSEFAMDELGEPVDAWEEFAPVSVRTLAPERTLMEKVALLHTAACGYDPEAGARGALQRGGRHLYDVHRLLASPQVLDALTALGPTGRSALWADIEAHSEAAGFAWQPRPTAGYASSPLLDPEAPAQTGARRAYESAQGLFLGEFPSFDECLDAWRTHADLL